MTPTEIRHAILDKGWTPLRLDGKNPRIMGKGWAGLEITHDVIDGWHVERHPRARKEPRGSNTGLRCDNGLIGIDLDTNHRTITRRAQKLVVQCLGDTPLLRIGNPVRSMLLYRTTRGHTPLRKTSQWVDNDGAGHRIEIKQNRGVIAAFGVHSPGNDFKWPRQSPLDLTPEDAPFVEHGTLVGLIGSLETWFEKIGMEKAQGTAGPGAGEWAYDLEPDMEFDTTDGIWRLDELEAFLKSIPNEVRSSQRIEAYMDPVRATEHNRMTGLVGLTRGRNPYLVIRDWSEDRNHTWADASRRTGSITVHHTDYSALAAKLGVKI